MDAKDIRSVLLQNKQIKKQAVRSLNSNSSTASSSSRSSKTLGWFMENGMFPAKGSSEEGNELKLQQKAAAISMALGEEKRKQKRVKKMSRKEDYIPGVAMSESSEEGYEEKRLNSLIADLVIQQKQQHQHQQQFGPPQKSPEDFWYYDVTSDGYYYEQNGAKGWRRRMPTSALKKIKEQENAMVSTTSTASTPATASSIQMNEAAMAAQAAATQAYLQQALFLQQQMQTRQQPTMRYYDPNSDGFYYEMASVDGWKRRQPNKPVSASMPHGVTRPFQQQQPQQMRPQEPIGPVGPNPMSYGATLARGQMPRNCVFDEGSASSSISGDNTLTDLLGPYEAVMPSISRPSSLSLEANESQMNPNFNADRFISALNFHEPNITRMFMPKTPDAKSFNQTPGAAAEDERMEHLIKGIENIWQSPTPLVNS